MSDSPTYTELRLANLKNRMTEIDDIAQSLVENAPNSRDFNLLLSNIRGILRQIEAFRKKYEGVKP